MSEFNVAVRGDCERLTQSWGDKLTEVIEGKVDQLSRRNQEEVIETVWYPDSGREGFRTAILRGNKSEFVLDIGLEDHGFGGAEHRLIKIERRNGSLVITGARHIKDEREQRIEETYVVVDSWLNSWLGNETCQAV